MFLLWSETGGNVLSLLYYYYYSISSTMSEVISFFPNSAKATSCSSDAASNTFQYFSFLFISFISSLLFSFKHPILVASPPEMTWNGMNWYMYTRCLNKEWQTWEFGIPSNQQNQHICVLSKYQQMFGFTLTTIDGMQNPFCINFFMCAS